MTKQYQLTSAELSRLKNALHAAYSIPFIDDIEDFAWESIFAYAKSIEVSDPLNATRSKQLFDVVNGPKKIGWSAKTQATTLNQGSEFEVVIQRATIFSKANSLGHKRLSKSSNPTDLGNALLTHWNRKKVQFDMEGQGVRTPRICFLLKPKSKKRGSKEFAYFELPLRIYSSREITWKWTDSKKRGLQGTRRSDRFVKYRWYPSGGQLFERFLIPRVLQRFKLNPTRLRTAKVVSLLQNELTIQRRKKSR